METILFVPAPKTEPSPPKRTMFGRLVKLMADMAVFPPEAPPKPKTTKPKTAKLVPIEWDWPWCLEVKLDNAAAGVFGIGLLSGGIGILAGLVEFARSDNASYFAWLTVIGGISAVASGYCISILFEAAAEIIRLLKKQAGLPVTGLFLYQCSVCQRQLTRTTAFCPGCELQFEK